MGVNSAMMNRSTQRELTKLLLQLSETLPQIDFCADEQKNMALDILENVAGKCRQDFSKAVAAKYADTMQALSQIIQITDWHCQSREENIQCHSLCQEIILQLVENLRHEKEIKKDIVFLPYKASMWDSLESVWKAAYEDKEHCNAYVIPIPYADLNPDRSVAAWHCERDQYPKYVPTLDWREVDLEKWHPDVIFIHNPYDNYNHITSVESRYYAQNLKHCTDKLVYIPYFVLEEPCTEESVEHFVLTAGVLSADKVIVQSEAMRELYIRILTKKTEQTDRTYWEKRISGAGSPKIEKVLTSKKEDFEMPEKWRKLVEGKKVILYNTSLSAMLQNSDKVCDKLRYVFDVFRNRDDVVLWWRPHPLMKSTFHSMRPQYEAEYLSLEKQYIEEGWGIYDDSSDLHRAICWSDAYYGDGSSVVSLYQKTGKFLLLQSLNVLGNTLVGVSCSFDALNNYIWLTVYGLHELYGIDLKTKNCNFYGYYDELNIPEIFGIKEKHLYAKSVRDKVLVFPWEASDIIEFDVLHRTYRSIPLNLKDGDAKFMGGVEYKGRLFCYGMGNSIYEYSPYDSSRYVHLIPNDIAKKNPHIVFFQPFIYQDKLWLIHYHGIVSFDLLSKQFKNHSLEGFSNFVSVTASDESIFLLTSDGTNIIEWMPDEGIRNIFKINNEPLTLFYAGLAFVDNKLFVSTYTFWGESVSFWLDLKKNKKIAVDFSELIMPLGTFNNEVICFLATSADIYSFSINGSANLIAKSVIDRLDAKKIALSNADELCGEIFSEYSFDLKTWLEVILNSSQSKMGKTAMIGKAIYNLLC